MGLYFSKNPNMKFTITCIALVLFLSACEDDNDNKPAQLQWKKLGLDGKIVNEMQLTGTTLYVATTSGLFKKQIASEESEFQSIGFGNKNVEAIQIIHDEEIIASLFDKTGSEEPALFKTTDDGENWIPVNSDFGGATPEPVFDLAIRPEDENVLYAAGFSVVAKSLDQGVTWEPIYGSWSGFATGVSVVEINPKATNEIWAGGQGAIENGFLIRSNNESDWDTWNDLVSNPTVVKAVTFSNNTKDEVYVGFEGALLKTTNGGDTWQTLIDSEDNKFYFGICTRNNNPDRVYAGGWLKTPDPQPLLLAISTNGGGTWEEFGLSSEAYGGILEMNIKSEKDKDVLYLGLDKGGVYRVTVSGF
jgi:hypothetical protein